MTLPDTHGYTFSSVESDAADAFRKFLADVRADSVPSEVERARSDNGGEFVRGDFGLSLIHISEPTRPY